ncbi:MAG: DUF5723 family protein [Flavobacteriaceae bacterium]|nr:DUF5723 family protein [Flavobacteriaceae bacterium]
MSQNTGLTPSLQLPIAQAEIQLNSFLDRLDFDVDYERDTYATIYISDTIQRLLEISIEDVYGPTELSAEVESSYILSPVELEDTTNDFNRISMSQATQLPDGTTTVIPPFQSIIVLGTIDMYNEPYRSARFFDGSIAFTVTNEFPMDADVRILLYDENDQLITSSETFSVAKNTSEMSSIQIDGLTISKILEAGADLSDSLDDQADNYKSPEDILDELTEDIKNEFSLQLTEDSCTEKLPSTISMGAEFRVHKNLDFGAMYAHYASPYYKRDTYAFSANLGIRNALSLSPTMMIVGGDTVWACAAAFRFGPLQFHMAINDFGGIATPADAQGIGIQMGMSYVFPFALIK